MVQVFNLSVMSNDKIWPVFNQNVLFVLLMLSSSQMQFAKFGSHQNYLTKLWRQYCMWDFLIIQLGFCTIHSYRAVCPLPKAPCSTVQWQCPCWNRTGICLHKITFLKVLHVVFLHSDTIQCFAIWIFIHTLIIIRCGCGRNFKCKRSRMPEAAVFSVHQVSVQSSWVSMAVTPSLTLWE